MIGIGAWLLALGVADLIAGGLAGEPRHQDQVAAGLTCGLLLVLLASWIGGLTGPACLGLMALTALGGGWLFFRLPMRQGGVDSEASLARLRLALGLLLTALLLTVVLSGEFQAHSKMAFRALEPMDVPWLSAKSSSQVILMVGTAVFLMASGNGVVRAVLDIANTELKRSGQPLEAGRFIGAIERLMIYGLAVAGEPTAVALIVSAKSLLRFPALSRKARQSDTTGEESGAIATVEYSTEYFLLGSLVSWFVALALALLALEPGGL